MPETNASLWHGYMGPVRQLASRLVSQLFWPTFHLTDAHEALITHI